MGAFPTGKLRGKENDGPVLRGVGRGEGARFAGRSPSRVVATNSGRASTENDSNAWLRKRSLVVSKRGSLVPQGKKRVGYSFKMKGGKINIIKKGSPRYVVDGRGKVEKLVKEGEIFFEIVMGFGCVDQLPSDETSRILHCSIFMKEFWEGKSSSGVGGFFKPRG